MGKQFHSAAETPVSRRPDENAKAIQALEDDPIIIPDDQAPMAEAPPPADNHAPAAALIIAGAAVVLLCLWWFAPQWLTSTGANFMKQILHLVGQ